jgi:hypothetical protein
VTTPVATSAIAAADRFTYQAATTTTTTPTTTSTTSTTAPTSTPTSTIPLAAPASATPPKSGSAGLAFTGFDLALLLFAGAASIGVGILLMSASRRTRRGRHARL